MSYELAKKLKESGYPQEPKIELPNSLGEGSMLGGFYWSFPAGGGCGGLVFFNKEELDKELNKKPKWEFVKSPTLEELIDACGGSRSSIGLQGFNKNWTAWIGLSHILEARGKNPEEAVALLYLNLVRDRVKDNDISKKEDKSKMSEM